MAVNNKSIVFTDSDSSVNPTVAKNQLQQVQVHQDKLTFDYEEEDDDDEEEEEEASGTSAGLISCFLLHFVN